MKVHHKNLRGPSLLVRLLAVSTVDKNSGSERNARAALLHGRSELFDAAAPRQAKAGNKQERSRQEASFNGPASGLAAAVIVNGSAKTRATRVIGS